MKFDLSNGHDEKQLGLCTITADLDEFGDVKVNATLKLDGYNSEDDLNCLYSKRDFLNKFNSDFSAWKEKVMTVYE